MSHRKLGNHWPSFDCSAGLLMASGGATVVREYLHGSGVILTTHGNGRVLCTRVKIMPVGTHEVRIGRAVAPVARFPRRRAKFGTAILKFGTDKIKNGTDKNENGTDTLSTCRSSARG